MTIEDQVCTIEQGIKLRQLGVTAPSIFKWEEWSTYSKSGCQVVLAKDCLETMEMESYIIYPAFTVAELGQLLGYCVACFPLNEAQYRASALIQDLENFVYTAEQANSRLEQQRK